MDLFASYNNLSSNSNKNTVENVLRSIINASPLALAPAERDKLVQLLLHDIRDSLDGSKGRLSRKDFGLALLALKTLGRAKQASEIISKSENLAILQNAASTLRTPDPEAADDALRCVANALLLVESGRSIWASVNGATHCVDLLEKSTSPTNIFLCSRILFLCTASSSSELLSILLDNPSANAKSGQNIPHDIIDTIAKQLNLLLGAIQQGSPMSKEATTDLLKFAFNILCHWPRIAPDAEDSYDNGEGSSTATHDSTPVLGERWSKRLDGLLPPLRRLFVRLPAMAPSPLSPPMTHVLHALLPIPCTERLQSIWLADSNDSGEASDRTHKGWKSIGSALWDSLPSRANHADSTTQEPNSQSSSPGASPKGKEKETDGKGALDRALSMLTPRRSLSSRSSSPVSCQAPRDFSRYPARPEVLARAMDLLDTSLAHYLPGNVDPDDVSVKQLCKQEDIELDHVMTPLVLLLTKLCKHNLDCRKTFRNRVLPLDLDRSSPLEQRSDTLGRFIRLMACVHHQQLKDAAGELMYVACDCDAEILTSQVGYGNAAGYLFNRGMLPAPPQGPSSGADAADARVNPITGMIQREQPPAPEMTDEEKEREAEKLFVLFERLEKAGGMENPIKKAFHEGKLEKYNMKKDEDNSD